MNPDRLAVLWCPHWPVVAVGAAADDPVAVLDASRVVARSQAAGAAGVRIGMRRREAQSRCPGLRVEQRQVDREAREFERVARAVGEHVPRLECTEPGVLVFRARGPARYFGGDAAMAALVARCAAGALAAGLGAVGGSVGMGVADGRFAATVAARAAVSRGEPVVVPPGGAAAFLEPLPVRLLADAAGVDHGFIGLLERLGITRLGDLAALPPVDIGDRFGPVGAFAHRLASGGDDRLPGVTDPPQARAVQRVFEEPVHHSDALVFVARQLAGELVGALVGLVCTRLVVTAETEHGERSERIWYRADGFGASAMVERVRWQLDAWARDDVLTAGVVLIRLDPAEVRADDGTPVTLWGGRTDADDRAVRAVARLTALVGEEHVLVPEPAGGRQPHDRYAWIPAGLTDLLHHESVAVAAPWPGSLPSPLPAVVHAAPQRVEVLDGAGRRVTVSGRGVVSAAPERVRGGGGDHAVVAWAGPWPLDERWWDPRRARRVARFQVVLDDGTLLLLGLERGEWSTWAAYA